MPPVSFVLSTMNRRDVLERTLVQIDACGLRPGEFETFVVDNASTDGTAAMVRERFPRVTLIALSHNGGGVSRNEGLRRARGEFVVMLDDDSYPMPGAVRRMVGHFRESPRLGAAVFEVVLPDGRRECSAYPDVFIGCGTGFRRAALEQVGYLPDDFFMQAEEYDLSLRLLDGGWEVRRFDDLLARHLKTTTARRPARTTRLDVRNNLMLIGRRFPRGQRRRFALDWARRYWLLASQQGHRREFVRGAVEGVARGIIGRREPVKVETFDRFARLAEIEATIRRLHDRGARQLLLLDAGKAVGSFVRAARRVGSEVVAIVDDRLAGRRLLGVPIVSEEEARRLEFDAAVVANLSPVHAALRQQRWAGAEVVA